MSDQTPTTDSGALSYAQAGVDIDAGNSLVERIKPIVKGTFRPGVMAGLGGFGALFELPLDRYREPVLVSGTDGVGTKLKLAVQLERHDTIGIDLVAMCVNDIVVAGAEPLFFLDYLALGKDNPPLIAELVEGVSEGCLQASASLIAGETAIMPDVYGEDDFDLAGFCVGVVERDQLIDGSRIAEGDVVLGLGSNGFHSNGYSLIRNTVFDHAGLTVDSEVDDLGQTVGDLLLTPTKIYAQETASAVKQNSESLVVTGIAHITGGGLAENLERILPEDVKVTISRDSWRPAACFEWLQNLGNIDQAEMDRVFNMGIGMVFIVRPGHAAEVEALLTQYGSPVYRLGQVEGGERSVVVV